MNYQWDRFDIKSYNNKVGKYKFQKEWNFITQFKITEEDSILDLAGGSGRFAIPLYDICKNITVFDINAEAIDILNNYNPYIKTKIEDINTIKNEYKYSLIICIEAFGYIQDLNHFLSDIKEQLSDEGRFIFTYNNPKSWRFVLKRIIRGNKNFTRYFTLDYDMLIRIINKNGYEIEKIEGMNWIPLKLSSNSIWVDFFVKIEKILKMGKWLKQSPVLLISLRKA